MNKNEIVEDLIMALAPSELNSVKYCPANRLIELHHGLGTHIRNTYGLWDEPWTPKLFDGVDYSEDHPDNISQAIIELLWRQLQEPLLHHQFHPRNI